MPDFSDLTKGSPPNDPRPYRHGVKVHLSDTGLGPAADKMHAFRVERGLNLREHRAPRKSSDYLKATTYLFPDEATAREWIALFGGEYVAPEN